MSNRLSSFIPLAPEITQANIASQFPKDTIKVPLPEMTHSEKLEKAEFDTKERKKLAKEKEAMPGGQFPIRNQKDLENAIHDVGRSNDPGKAKSWIKKRAKELDCEDCLPGSWQKATEDELNMFKDELEKGGKGSGPHKLGETEHTDSPKGGETYKYITSSGRESFFKYIGKKPGSNGYYKIKMGNDGVTTNVTMDTIKEMMESGKNDKSTKVKKSLKKDMDGDGGGDEMEESVNKAFDNILGIEPDPIEKAFEDLIGVETDPVEKAFNNLLEKGGIGSGRKIGQTKSGKPIYNHFEHEGHENFTYRDHEDAAKLHVTISPEAAKKAQMKMKSPKPSSAHSLEARKHLAASRLVHPHYNKNYKEID